MITQKLETSNSSSIYFGWDPDYKDGVYFVRKHVESPSYEGYAKNGMNLSYVELEVLCKAFRKITGSKGIGPDGAVIATTDAAVTFEINPFEAHDRAYLVITKVKKKVLGSYRTRGLAVPVPLLEDFTANLNKLLVSNVDGRQTLNNTEKKKVEIEKKLADNSGIITQRQSRVLRLRYGIDGLEPHTLQEIADEFGLSRERIRQIITKAELKLKR